MSTGSRKVSPPQKQFSLNRAASKSNFQSVDLSGRDHWRVNNMATTPCRSVLSIGAPVMIARHILFLVFSLILPLHMFGAEFQSADLVGDWTGRGRDGTTIKFTFHKDGSAAWFVDEPSYKKDWPSGLKGKYTFREKSPNWEIDIYDFEDVRFQGKTFQAILQPIEKGKFKMEGDVSNGGKRPSSFGEEAIVFSTAHAPDSTYEPVWTRNARLAAELSLQADQLAKAGDQFGAWQKLTEAVHRSPHDPLLLRDFCNSSFDMGRYRDVVWSARKLSEKNRLTGEVQSKWGISLAVLGEYEQAAQIFRDGLERFASWENEFREWSITLTYLNKDFLAAREEARAHPVQTLAGSDNGSVWNLLVKRIPKLCDMADIHTMQYPLLEHLSQLHRLLRDGIESGYLSYETPEWKAKVGEISRDLAWRTIRIYRSLPVKPLPPSGAMEKARRALNVIATESERMDWRDAVRDLMDVTRRVPWWAEAHYNLAVLLENQTSGSGGTSYYHYGMFDDGADNRLIAAQEYIFCVGADPRGSKADPARKMLKEWKQPIPQ